MCCLRDAKHIFTQSHKEWLFIYLISNEASLCGMAGTSLVMCASLAPLLCMSPEQNVGIRHCAVV